MQISSNDETKTLKLESWLAAGNRRSERGWLESSAQPRRLLVVRTRNGDQSAVKDYALQLSRRLDCEVVLLTLVDAEPHGDEPTASDPPARRAPSCPSNFTRSYDGEAKPLIECHAEQDEVASAVERLCREIRRIEFILTDSDVVKDILSETAVIPVFRMVADTAHPEGGCNMSSNTATIRKKPVGKTIIFGALTAALYAAVFWKSDLLMKFFARGGLYAALPIATAIIFSFAHGAFASNLWSLLGIHARTKVEAHKSISPGAPSPKVKPKRPRAYAYVNPFHNIELKRK